MIKARIILESHGQRPLASQVMSLFDLPPSSTAAQHTTQYGRTDLQAAFNWLVNQPEHIRKQASDPDRLMTLFYRSCKTNLQTDAPVSSQNFLSDLRQINETLRQFEPPKPITTSSPSAAPATAAKSSLSKDGLDLSLNLSLNSNSNTNPNSSPNSSLNPAALAMLEEVRSKFNLSSDKEALQLLISVGHKQLAPLLA